MINKYSWEIKEGEIPQTGVCECKTCRKNFVILEPREGYPIKCPNCGKDIKNIEHLYIGKWGDSKKK